MHTKHKLEHVRVIWSWAFAFTLPPSLRGPTGPCLSFSLSAGVLCVWSRLSPFLHSAPARPTCRSFFFSIISVLLVASGWDLARRICSWGSDLLPLRCLTFFRTVVLFSWSDNSTRIGLAASPLLRPRRLQVILTCSAPRVVHICFVMLASSPFLVMTVSALLSGTLNMIRCLALDCLTSLSWSVSGDPVAPPAAYVNICSIFSVNFISIAARLSLKVFCHLSNEAPVATVSAKQVIVDQKHEWTSRPNTE